MAARQSIGDTPAHRCLALAFNLCCADAPQTGGGSGSQAQDISVPARRQIWRENETVDGLPVICQGWAATFLTMTDGRRQILSFLLPGDLVSTSFIADPISRTTLEAITDVRYRVFPREGFLSAIARDPKMITNVAKLWADESARADQLAIDLGQRSADERVASLILHLTDRLTQRGLMLDGSVEFPLRQHHIADATGLTPVHAGKMMTEFRRAGLIDLSERSLTLLKPDELRQVAGLH
jgi:CRP/FNR family transcriptional regulator